MVASQGQIPKEALGKDLMAGDVHARTDARNVASDQGHRPVKRRLRTKTNVSELERGRTNMPIAPRLRALRGDPEDIPVSESSATSTVSPRSGSARVHPYHNQLVRLLGVHHFNLFLLLLTELPALRD